MSRSKGSNSAAVSMREALECAAAGMVRVEYVLRITRLRMAQVRARVGLHDLIDPAIDEVDDVVRAARAAKVQIGTALALLVGD